MSHAESDVVRRAIEHLDRGEDQEALALLGPHVLRHPDDVEALFRLGIATARTRRLIDAIRIFSRVLELDPEHGRAMWNLGRAQLFLDDPHAAEPYLRLALRRVPDEPELWADLAVALRSLQRPRDARVQLEQAVARFPEDAFMKARLLAAEIQDESLDAAARSVARLEANHPDDPVAAAAILQYCVETGDVERARRAAERLSAEGESVVDYDDLLREIARAFPPSEGTVLREGEESLTCPACGHRALRTDIRALVFDGDPLDRIAALGAWLQGNRCACGVFLPRPRGVAVLMPELSLAVLADTFPADDTEVGDVEATAAGTFGEPDSAAPRAEVWFAFAISGPAALALALAARETAIERESSLPEIGELGRAERRAKETVAALRVSSGDEEEGRHGEVHGVPDWMRGERERLLESGIDCAPWPLSHACRCGARLEPFLFGQDRGAPYPPDAVDAAAIAGLPFRDDAGDLAFGFNCDACGRLHTWILGVLPPSA
jgi:Flp pilus assembly protein TadD